MNELDARLKKGVEAFEVTEDIMEQWQEITNSMAKLVGVPAGLIMRLNGKKIEVFTTSKTENNPYKPNDSEHFFESGLYCETVVRTGEKLFVADALKDDDWKDNPDVELNMINYLGFPIKKPDNTPFGTLCILDDHERHYSAEQENLIIQFRNILESQLHLISKTQDLSKSYNVIADSIDYASRIQRSVLPDDALLSAVAKDHFILWEPRDVVGGDVYWCHEWGDGFLLILGDCTGHGVPGAFMTLISNGALERAMGEIPVGDVSGLVQRMHQYIQQSLGQDGDLTETDDGLELGACFVNPARGTLTFVGAWFDLFIVKDGSVVRLKGVKKGLGYREIPHDQEFKQVSVDIVDTTAFYMTTDGAVDQIGETNQRSFGIKRFESLLLDVQNSSMAEQKEVIRHAIVTHQGSTPRVDDIAVIGFKLA